MEGKKKKKKKRFSSSSLRIQPHRLAHIWTSTSLCLWGIFICLQNWTKQINWKKYVQNKWFRRQSVHIKHRKGTRWTWRRWLWKSKKKKHCSSQSYYLGHRFHNPFFICLYLSTRCSRGGFRRSPLSPASVSCYHRASPLTNFPPVSEIWPIKPSATINPEPWLICESNYLPVCNGCVQCYDGKSAVVSICP